MTEVSRVLLNAIDIDNKPTNNLWLATIGDAVNLQNAINDLEDLDDVDHLGRTLLHLAVESGSIRTVQLLLDKGLNPNAKDEMGNTPLFYATIKRASLPIATMLFKYGATIPIRKCSTDIGLFLEFVIMSKPTPEEEQLIKLLLNNGASLEDPAAPGGRQALHYAAMSNNTELIRALAHLGADLNVTNYQDMTPMDVAIFYECKEAQFCIEDMSITNILVDNRSSLQSTKAPSTAYSS